MDSINLGDIDNPWAAVVAVVIVLALMVWPGVMAWLTRRTVRHEMKPNSGTSLRDSTDRIEATLATVVATQAEHGRMLADHGATLAEQDLRLDRIDPLTRRSGRMPWRRTPR